MGTPMCNILYCKEISPDVIIIEDDEEQHHLPLNSRNKSSNEGDAKDLLGCLNEWETGPTGNTVIHTKITNSLEKDCEITIIHNDLTEESEVRLQELEKISEETVDTQERSLKFKIEREIIEKQHGDNQLRFEVTGLLGFRQFRGLFERDDKKLEVITKYKPVERLSQLKPGEDINMSVLSCKSSDCNSLQTKILAFNNFKPLSIPKGASTNEEEASRDTTSKNVPVSSMARRMQELVKNTLTKKRKRRNKGEEINKKVKPSVEPKGIQIELNINFKPIECLSQMEADEKVNKSVPNPKQIQILASNYSQPLSIPKEIRGPQKVPLSAITNKNVPLSCIAARNQKLVKNTQIRKRKRKYLDAHKGEEINRGEKPFQCNICEAKFRQKIQLKQHLQKHTGEKPFQCNICDAKFVAKYNLKQHLQIHTGEKPFQCNICEAKFRQKIHFKQHLQIHMGEKPFQCNICETKFRQKIHFKRHLQIHTGEKPFQCNICEAKFTQKIHLKHHFQIHTGEKPFQCNICEAKFTQKIHLKHHFQIHTGEKPFQCNICHVKFGVKYNLKRHLQIHTGEKPFQCNM